MDCQRHGRRGRTTNKIFCVDKRFGIQVLTLDAQLLNHYSESYQIIARKVFAIIPMDHPMDRNGSTVTLSLVLLLGTFI